MTTSLRLSQLLTAATNVYNKWDRLYDEALTAKNSAILNKQYSNSSSELLHKAYVRREGARIILEVIIEIQKEEKEKEDKNIVMTHTNINVK